jgi:hypothetical protein
MNFMTFIKEADRIAEGIHEIGNVVYASLGYNAILQKRDGKMIERCSLEII